MKNLLAQSLLAQQAFPDGNILDLLLSEIRQRTDAYRASIGKLTTVQAGYFGKTSSKYRTLGLVSHEEVEAMLDKALQS